MQCSFKIPPFGQVRAHPLSSRPVPLYGGHADVAQLVAHHLAKVNVAGSSPVIRSKEVDQFSIGEPLWWDGREARLRTANPATRVQIPFPPRWCKLNSSKPRTIGAAVAHFLDMEGVTGSIPVSSTILTVANSLNQVVSQHDLHKQISENNAVGQSMSI